MGDAEAWAWVCPPADWSDIPDWDLMASVQLETRRIDEQCRTEHYMTYFGAHEDEIDSFREAVRTVDMGLLFAAEVWNSLSEAQQSALAREHAGGPRQGLCTSKPTRRSLVRRGLMDDMGLTEKGRFVLLEGLE